MATMEGMAMKSDYYDIEATVKMRYKVSFSEPLSFSDAKDAFMNGDEEDIADEELLEIITIDRAVQLAV